MDLYEYQGKQYLARWGVPVLPGGLAVTVEEAVARADELGYPVVVKAQVRVGGRGKAGGIKVAKGPDEVAAHARAILGMDIKGHLVRRLWLERAAGIAAELYAGVTLDRAARCHLVMVSARGGIDIEEVAEEDPGAVARLLVDPLRGLDGEGAREVVAAAALPEAAREGAAEVLVGLYRGYVEGDADLVEVNPLVLTDEGAVLALDAKVVLDDNAAFRHPEWDAFQSTDDLDGRERLARERGLNYIGLEGTVGIVANGAGLAMSTLDVVNQVGGSAANFLDIGGGASAATMAAALEVVNSDPRVGAILVNIFGGITRGDQVAAGIIEALARVELGSPIVVRLDGTNAVEGLSLLEGYRSATVAGRPSLVVRATMLEAARTAVELAAGARP